MSKDTIPIPIKLRKELRIKIKGIKPGYVVAGFQYCLNKNIEILKKENIIYHTVKSIQDVKKGIIEYGQFTEDIIINAISRKPYQGTIRLIKALLIAAYGSKWKIVFNKYFDKNINTETPLNSDDYQILDDIIESHIEIPKELNKKLYAIEKLIQEREFDKAEIDLENIKSETFASEIGTAVHQLFYVKILQYKYFNFNKSAEILKKVVITFKKHNFKKKIFEASEELARNLVALGQFDIAEKISDELLELSLKNKSLNEQITIYILKGFCELEKQIYQKAIEYFKEALKIGKLLSISNEEIERSQSDEAIQTCLHNLSLAYKRDGKI